MFLFIWHQHIKHMERRFPDLYKPNRAFISPASFNIFNRLCDSLVLLVLAYDRFYPDQPFCPWLLGTEFVEHFFGLARTLLPNFTYAELLKLVKHVMLRQTILLSGKITAKKERTSRAGYVLDYDPSPLTPDELKNARVRMPESLLNQLVELAYKEATQIAKQLLRMPLPTLPFNHIPLRPPNASARRRKRAVAVPDSDEEDAVDDEVCGEDEDDDSEDEEAAGSGPIASIAMCETGCPTQAPDSDPSSPADSNLALLAEQTADAAGYTSRYAALSEDFDTALQELSEASKSEPSGPARDLLVAVEPFIGPLPLPPPPPPPSASTQPFISPVLLSQLFDEKKISVQRMVDVRIKNQSGTATRSERVVMLDPKFALGRLNNPDSKMSMREGSHHVRVAQDLGIPAVKKAKTAREQRWNETAQQVQLIVREEGMFVTSYLSLPKVFSLHPSCGRPA